MSSITLGRSFLRDLDLLSSEIETAAEDAMRAAMDAAANDARKMKRWRSAGTYTATDKDGALWEWEVTGLTAESITGYVVGNKQLKALNPARAVRRKKDGYVMPLGANGVDPSVTGDYAPEPGKVIGIVTMYTAYAPYLQKKEREGSVWGIPGAGDVVTEEVLAANWENGYLSQILIPRLERAMQRLQRRLSS